MTSFLKNLKKIYTYENLKEIILSIDLFDEDVIRQIENEFIKQQYNDNFFNVFNDPDIIRHLGRNTIYKVLKRLKYIQDFKKKSSVKYMNDLSTDEEIRQRNRILAVGAGVASYKMAQYLRREEPKTIINKDSNEDLKQGGVNRTGKRPIKEIREEGQPTSPPKNKVPPVVKTVPQPQSSLWELEYPTTQANVIKQDIKNLVNDNTKYRTTMLIFGALGVFGIFLLSK